MITKSDIYYSKLSSWYFISNFCQTFDEHDQQAGFKRFPQHWTFLKERCCDPLDRGLIKYHEKRECQKFLIPKSRQMMVSWTLAGWILQLIMFYDMQLALWMSKREKDAVYQVGRIRHLYQNLLEKEYWHMNYRLSRPFIRQKNSVLEMANGSKVEAVPEGGDIIHSRVPTVVIADEFQLQDEAERSYKAAIPCSQLLVMVLTAEPSFAQRLVQDTDGDLNELAIEAA